MLKIGLEEGVFVLILDGLDEVQENSVDLILHELTNIRVIYPKTNVYVSSRPNRQFEATQSFDVYHILPLSKDRTIKVLKNMEIMNDVKDIFIERVDSALYESHTEFLSSPLLATMMLIVFVRFDEIPSSFNFYYEQAFETLYISHDLTKEGRFKRKHFSGLNLDSFKDVFSAFCYASKIEQKISFSYDELLRYITKSVNFLEITLEPDLFISDLENSVCVLQRDGLKLTFVHRSFQEFFAAKFVSNYRGDDMFGVISPLASAQNIAALVMLHGLNPYLVNRYWAIPAIEGLLQTLEGIDPSQSVQKFLSVFYVSLNGTIVPESVGRSWRGGMGADVLISLQALYPKVVPNVDAIGNASMLPERFRDFTELLSSGRVDRGAFEIESSEVERGGSGSFSVVLGRGDHSWLNDSPMVAAAQETLTSLKVALEHIKLEVLNRKPVKSLF